MAQFDPEALEKRVDARFSAMDAALSALGEQRVYQVYLADSRKLANELRAEEITKMAAEHEEAQLEFLIEREEAKNGCDNRY
ncbi:hypothetical protein [Aggregatibacter kilianii]|jgi:hypothetical protein|uniref:hypothetical protein n=1 Tax=Aggregatibacter kilianii TaxID=2025884 RepID=UPI000D65E23D|nr:hypothetical protein [Aggregatibacter kilianii]DAK67504.1 MAG TPA: Adenosylhomocysteinase [Caudoviricetes sp.]